MDLIWTRVMFTICVFISFMMILFIVTRKSNKANYDDAARSIINDPDTPSNQTTQINHEHGAK